MLPTSLLPPRCWASCSPVATAPRRRATPTGRRRPRRAHHPDRGQARAGAGHGACYDLDLEAAVSPTSDAPPRLRRASTPPRRSTSARSTTWSRATCSPSTPDACRTAWRRTCPGGSTNSSAARWSVRLSMLKPVWFTPTVEQSDAGADWFRCDVVVLSGADRLAPVSGSPEGRARHRPGAATATACAGPPDPTTPTSSACSAADPHLAGHHRRRAPDGRRIPARRPSPTAGTGPCEDAGATVADDPLDYQWGYEGPDKQQWDAGQTFGRCWAPSPQ